MVFMSLIFFPFMSFVSLKPSQRSYSVRSLKWLSDVTMLSAFSFKIKAKQLGYTR